MTVHSIRASRSCPFAGPSFLSSLYPSELKRWFLASSVRQHILGLHSRLAIRQWSLAPDTKICATSLPNSQPLNSLGYITPQDTKVDIVPKKRIKNRVKRTRKSTEAESVNSLLRESSFKALFLIQILSCNKEHNLALRHDTERSEVLGAAIRRYGFAES